MEIKRNTINMEKKMNEILRKKKTRRGKKVQRKRNSDKVNSEGNENVLSTFTDPLRFHPFHSKSRGLKRNHKNLRPTSPKAPKNSTTFLIEDSGNDIDFNYYSPTSMENDTTFSISPEHMLDEGQLMDYDSCSMYSDEAKCFKKNLDEQDYTPICFQETVDFISKECDRDLARYQYEEDIVRKSLLSNTPKIELVKKIMEMENTCNNIALPVARKSLRGLKDTVSKLQKENEELKMENQLLKSLAS